MNTLDEILSLSNDLSSILEKIINRSTVCERHSDTGHILVVTPNPWAWAPLPPEDQVLVGDARKLLDIWYQLGQLAISASAPDLTVEFQIEAEVLRTIVDRGRHSKGPVAPTLDKILTKVGEALDAQKTILNNLPSALKLPENLFVPDTNALLVNPQLETWRLATPPYTIVLVPQVIRELDKHKVDRRKPVGKKAMKLVSQLREYGRRGDTFKGVPLIGKVSYREVAIEPDMNKTLSWLRSGHGDDEFLASSLELKWENLKANVTLVTGDGNLLNKARLARVNALDLETIRRSIDTEPQNSVSSENKNRSTNSRKAKTRSESSPPGDTVTVQPVWDKAWINRHRDHANMGLQAVLRSPSPGYVEIGFSLSGNKPSLFQKDLLEAAKSSQIHTFGWPIAVVLDQRDEYRPRPTSDGISAEIAMEDRKSYDYWAFRKNGDFYLLQSLFEDMRTSGELFFNTRIVRIAEALLYCARVYSRLGVSPSTEVNIFIVHGGLRNRRLTSSRSTRPLHGNYTTIQDLTDGAFSIPIRDIEPNLVRLVKSIAEPLFVVFDYYAPSDSIYANIIHDFLEGRVT